MEAADLLIDPHGQVFGPKKTLEDDGIALADNMPGHTCLDTEEKSSLLTIKERLAMLDGAFPMDEAVVEGTNPRIPEIGRHLRD